MTDCIQFGKYKGTEYSELPPSYVAWLLKQDNLKEDIKEALYSMIIKKHKEEIINNYIRDNYNPNFYKRSNSSCSYSSSCNYIPPDFDYGGDLFDAMQGCTPNF